MLGFRRGALDRLPEKLEEGIAQGLFSCAVYAVLRHGWVAAHGAVGLAQPDASPPARAGLDTVFDMASVTKAMTGTLLMTLVEEGMLRLNHPLERFLPETTNHLLGSVTLRHLATHTSGLLPWLPLYKSSRPVIEQILEAPLDASAGIHYAYSDLGYILLGIVLERVTRRSMAELLTERIASPLRMIDSGYLPPASRHDRIAATAHFEAGARRILIGEVHDENAQGMRGVAGHAGLFSTLPDMVGFAAAYQFPAAAEHIGLQSPLSLPARRAAQTIQCDPKVGSHGIGWFVSPSGYLPTGDLLSDRCYGHTGFTGTMILFDPVYELCLILLTNRVYAANDGSAFLAFRHQFSNLVAGSVMS